jgi:hypothetical protein
MNPDQPSENANLSDESLTTTVGGMSSSGNAVVKTQFDQQFNNSSSEIKKFKKIKDR